MLSTRAALEHWIFLILELTMCSGWLGCCGPVNDDVAWFPLGDGGCRFGVRVWTLFLDSPQRVSQIDRVHRGASEVLAENIPVEPAWVMPAKGVFDVQDRRAAVPVARGERNRAVFSPASTVGLVARICGR